MGEVVPRCGFDLPYPMISDLKVHLFLYLLAICMSSLEKYSDSLPTF